MRKISMIFVLVAGLVWAGCDWGGGGGAKSCASDDDCEAGVCLVESGTCVTCLESGDCPDGKVCDAETNSCVGCTENADCPGGVCQQSTQTCVACVDDGDCGTGSCVDGACVAPSCETDDDCVATGGQCSFAVCLEGSCAEADMPDNFPCDDGDECTAQDRCLGGECQGQPVPGCMGPCTGEPDGAPCDDGDPCTMGDICMDGACMSGQLDPACMTQDLDGDGWSIEEGDCDDENPDINPKAKEVCGNGVDDNCDGVIDEGCGGQECYPWDEDACPQDSFCLLPDGMCMLIGADEPPDPGNAGQCMQIPGACPGNWKPVCGCDGETYSNKCDMMAHQQSMLHEGKCDQPPPPECEDLTGYDFGPCDMMMGWGLVGEQCQPISGCECGDLCDFIFGTKIECQKTCDIKPGWDMDGDGWPVEEGDCDDYDPGVYPGAYEACDNIDNDCDGQVDEGCSQQECYPGWGNTCAGNQYCKMPEGMCWEYYDDIPPEDIAGTCVEIPDFCPEYYSPVCGCDGETYDNECFMEAAAQSMNYPGYCEGPPPECMSDDECPPGYQCDVYCGNGWCEGKCVPYGDPDMDGDGWTVDEGDCNDMNPMVNPGAEEVCDNLDNNCNGQVDEYCGGNICEDEGGMCVGGWDPDWLCPPGMEAWDLPCGDADAICCMPTNCAGEGEKFMNFPGEAGCCPGLTPIQTAWFDPETGICGVNSEGMVCSYCGNGWCEEEWENICNCPEDCDGDPNQCKAVDPWEFGPCAALIGWAWTGDTCQLISGCGCEPHCASFFPTYNECMNVCQ